METITYWNGIAILQLIVFPIILIAAIFIWKRTGWRVGSKIWRYAVTLSLIRIAGSISSLLSISNDSHNIEVAVAVCQLIGLAPLLLTFIGLLRQMSVGDGEALELGRRGLTDVFLVMWMKECLPSL